MSNLLSVRRVKVQTINEDGTPDGEPTFGVMAADGYASDYIDVFPDLIALNTAIQGAGCILSVIPNWGELWCRADTVRIGLGNFCSADWELPSGEIDPALQIYPSEDTE